MAVCYERMAWWTSCPLVQVYDAVVDYVLVDTEKRKPHLSSLYEEIQWPFIRTHKYASNLPSNLLA